VKWLALLTLLSSAARAEECDGFSLVLEREGARIFNRKIDGSSVRELCATLQLDATPAEVHAVLSDMERRLPPTSEVERVSASVYYMVIDPGFIDRRDYCVEIQSSRDADSYSISWHQVDCPLRRLTRMVANRGFWKITPRGTGSAILYRTHADPGGLVPAWLVNAASARRLPEIFSAIRSELRKQKVSRR
jgi:hypothetical protein